MIDWDKTVLAPLENVFGETARWVPANGAPYDIAGVFDEAFKSVDLGGTNIPSDAPVIGVRLSLFLLPPLRKDQIVITANEMHGGGTFVVKEVEPDGHGWAKLLLNYVGA